MRELINCFVFFVTLFWFGCNFSLSTFKQKSILFINNKKRSQTATAAAAGAAAAPFPFVAATIVPSTPSSNAIARGSTSMSP